MPFFLIVGALEPRKNIKLILEALQLIGFEKAASKGIRVIHAGPSGWRNSTFAHLVEKAQKAGIWEQLGTVTSHQLQLLYAKATALLYPSIYEGFGIPPFEALLHGCPVVLNDIPVFREFHSQGVLWITESDVSQLADVIIDLHQNPEAAERTGREGMRSLAANQDLTWQAAAKKTASVYRLTKEFTHK
jgi:glycosyltransferase involved in cell wall biosynthesis